MTREELIKEIVKRMKEIRELYYSVYPEGNYLTMYFEKNIVSFNNLHWEGGEDEKYPIDYHENEYFIRMNGEYEGK